MAISWFIGAGVQDALSQQVAEQLRQAMFEEEQRQAQAREGIALGEQQSRERDREERARLTQELRDMQKAEAAAAAEKAAYDQTANANMAELTNDPVQLEAFGVASGQIKPIDLLRLRQEKPARYTPPLKVVGQAGKPEFRQFEEGKIPEGTQVWDEPAAAGGGKPRVNIRSVQSRGPNSEPGTKTMVEVPFSDYANTEAPMAR